MAGLTPEGFVGATVEELQADFARRQRATIDAQLNTTATALVGQFNGIYASSLAEVWEAAQDTFDQMDPAKAVGIFLDSLSAITGTVRRQATRSTATLRLTLSSGTTVETGAVVALNGDPSVRFLTLAKAVNETGVAAQVLVEAEAESAGPVFAAAGALTEIATPVSGWTAVTNDEDATLGLAQETDSELRVRRVEELSAIGGGTLPGLLADLLRVADVTAAQVIENVSDTTDSEGLPPHAFESVVEGGADEVLAAQIWRSKPLGIQAHGTSQLIVTDSEGGSHQVGLTRPRLVELHVAVAVLDYDAITWSDFEALRNTIATTLVTETQRTESSAYIAAGSAVYAQQLARVLLKEVPQLDNLYVNLGLSTIATPTPAGSIGSVAAAPRTRLVVTTDRVHVVEASDDA